MKNIKKGATVERARDFARDTKKLGLTVHGDFIIGLPGETRETIEQTIKFAKELDVETIQVSLAHAYPGTELFEFAKENGFIVNSTQMVDEGGHQLAQIEYPGLPREEAGTVHRFYDEYYFRPKAVFRIVRKAFFNNVERKRLYKEAKSFMKLRAARMKIVKASRKAGAFNPVAAKANGNGGSNGAGKANGHGAMNPLPILQPAECATRDTRRQRRLGVTLRKYLVLVAMVVFVIAWRPATETRHEPARPDLSP